MHVEKLAKRKTSKSLKHIKLLDMILYSCENGDLNNMVVHFTCIIFTYVTFTRVKIRFSYPMASREPTPESEGFYPKTL